MAKITTTDTAARTYTRKPITLSSVLVKENFVLPSNNDRPTPEEIELAVNIVRRTYANYPIAVADAFLAGLKEDLGVDTEVEG